MSEEMSVYTVLTVFFLYFLPGFMAASRKHLNGKAIFALNLFLGWTFIGWIIAFVWSLTSNTEKVQKIEAQ